MKFEVTMKCPDALEHSIKHEGLFDEEQVDKMFSIAKKWFKYGEYITVIIDTDEETCVVKPC